MYGINLLKAIRNSALALEFDSGSVYHVSYHVSSLLCVASPVFPITCRFQGQSQCYLRRLGLVERYRANLPGPASDAQVSEKV